MARKKKLGAPYKLSDQAQAAREDLAMQRAASKSSLAGADAAMFAGSPIIDNVEDAISASRDLNEVNRKLRAARRPRG